MAKIKTSTAGRLNNYSRQRSVISCPPPSIKWLKRDNGFTLIELIVVMALIGCLLAFSIPRFHDTLLTNPTKKTSRWIIGTVKALKESSLREHRIYTLHVGLDTNTLWVTNETMTEEAVSEAAENGYKLPHNVRLLDVEFPVMGKVTTAHADILFYPQGYSDKALIHLANGDSGEHTYLIEPFLTEIIMHERYAGFND